MQNDILFGLPVVLDTDSEDYKVGDTVLLQYQGQDLAVFTIESKWVPHKPLEAKHCYGTTSIEHPAVQMITMERGKYYMGALLRPLPSLLCSGPAGQSNPGHHFLPGWNPHASGLR
jgi:sulfate adenylyltransferase